MKITALQTDEWILRELGERLTHARLEHHLTQAELADLGGLSKRTVERLEMGETGTRLTALLRVCRVLGSLERMDLLLPEAVAGPMAQMARSQPLRQRVSRRKSPLPPKKWTWGEAS